MLNSRTVFDEVDVGYQEVYVGVSDVIPTLLFFHWTLPLEVIYFTSLPPKKHLRILYMISVVSKQIPWLDNVFET